MTTRILVVDDDPDLLLLLRVTLATEDFQCLLARNGQDALRELELEQPDVILLDIMMPVIDGWEVIRRVAEHRPGTPVIVVSAKASETDVARALELGAADYIIKPFDPDDLLHSIERLAHRSPEEIARLRAERLWAATSKTV
jgi:DNA-binding response OmpR family regulator